MHRNLKLLALVAALACLAVPATPQGRAPFEPPAARVTRAPAGRGLTLPSTASPRAVLAQFLRGQGRSEATVQSLVEAQRTTGRGGIVEVQGTAEGEAIPREELDRMMDLALAGVAELVSLEERVVASAGVDLAKLMP